MGVGILYIQAERSGHGLNGIANLLLRELAVPERIPAPRGVGVLLHVSSQQWLNFLETTLSNVVFESGYFGGIVFSAHAPVRGLGSADTRSPRFSRFQPRQTL